MGAVDLQAAQVAVEQGAHSAMFDNGKIAIFMLRRNVVYGLHNSRLGSACGYPSLEACLRVGKERIGGGFEKWRRQKASCASVVFANDDLALGAMMHCHSHGILMPNDLALAGFNGLDIRDGITPHLTTIRSPRAEIGARAGQIMLDRIGGRSDAERGRIYMPLSFLLAATT